MKKTCIIGDIHGCHKSLTMLLAAVEGLANTFIFLGDYIDRGPDTQKVLDATLAFKQQHKHVITLIGNHELMLLNFLSYRDNGFFLQFGGKQTLASYGLPANSSPSQVKKAIPSRHLAFLHDLPLLWEDMHAFMFTPDYNPRCIRAGKHATGVFGQGNSSFTAPMILANRLSSGTPFLQNHSSKNKIGIDTGAVYGQSLTALLLPDMEFISVPGETESPYQRR